MEIYCCIKIFFGCPNSNLYVTILSHLFQGEFFFFSKKLVIGKKKGEKKQKSKNIFSATL